jgi:nucleotidyltransferase substrate binding protein (TIGR01987 family)
MNQKTIRWQQRFENLSKANSQLKRNLQIKSPNEAEKQGIIKSFEFTFELSWKTLKDYLESEGILTNSPREVIKQAFHTGIINEGDLWIDMLDQRNLMARTYDDIRTQKALDLIRNDYYNALENLITDFEKKLNVSR